MRHVAHSVIIMFVIVRVLATVGIKHMLRDSAGAIQCDCRRLATNGISPHGESISMVI